jgi:hypothetical protein
MNLYIKTIWVFLIFIFTGSVTPNLANPIEKMGLVESRNGYQILKPSIRLAQEMLGGSTKIVLLDGERLKTQTGKSNVAVYAVTHKAGSGLGKLEIMVTDPQCHYIIAQIDVLSDWLAKYTGSSNYLVSMRNSDKENILVYMLLHEVGHIANKHCGMIPSSSQKERENDADYFAANLIRSAVREKGTQRGLDASMIASTLTMFSWNIATHHVIDDFGGRPLRKSSIFGDSSSCSSHPNLEWRILGVNDLIQHTASSHKLLTDFAKSRYDGPSKTPLYKAPARLL